LTFEDSLYTQGVAAVLLDNNGPGWAAFDFVSVNAIPEPSSASLFAVGILGLLRRRRKSR
ncbi:MAG: PEP-CTERM sorting domain-containing protein, partial [Planctomycetales bacterium]|nr:PEP-CTERM sorting domain-containing protein [Planctomycetales bacterium]